MILRRANDIPSSEITPPSAYFDRLNRRAFLAAGAGALAAWSGLAAAPQWKPGKPGPYDTSEELTPYDDVTTYNNFYEFGTDKDDPSQNAGRFKPKPWKVKVDGDAGKPGEYDLDHLLKGRTLQDRIYRLRCVEGWSMVIPWYGFPLAELLKKFEPGPKAKFVEFTTVLRPEEMPGQERSVLDWPYVEGLRIDEAMHPLAILATGLYGENLPNQNGAPLRLVVPWKYGFKSIKSIVRIRFTEKQPLSSWERSAPQEYGFYSNVNPEVDHPRWSQARERRIGEFLKRKTLMFNGYADQVGSLYAGMDLKKNY